jgi:uncharacterized protein
MDAGAKAAIIAATEAWLEAAVIGLNLCPFARAVHAEKRIRYVVSEAATAEALLDALLSELEFLAAADADEVETTLLIHPLALGDFLDYNDFLDTADAAVDGLSFTGEIQVASFHPHYRFAGTGPEDIENFSNRSPHPMLHLLREASVERAVASHPDTGKIPEKNIATLRRLGRDGWDRLMQSALAKK